MKTIITRIDFDDLGEDLNVTPALIPNRWYFENMTIMEKLVAFFIIWLQPADEYDVHNFMDGEGLISDGKGGCMIDPAHIVCHASEIHEAFIGLEKKGYIIKAEEEDIHDEDGTIEKMFKYSPNYAKEDQYK